MHGSYGQHELVTAKLSLISKKTRQKMKNKNRVRVSSGSDQLEVRTLLSGSSAWGSGFGGGYHGSGGSNGPVYISGGGEGGKKGGGQTFYHGGNGGNGGGPVYISGGGEGGKKGGGQTFYHGGNSGNGGGPVYISGGGEGGKKGGGQTFYHGGNGGNGGGPVYISGGGGEGGGSTFFYEGNGRSNGSGNGRSIRSGNGSVSGNISGSFSGNLSGSFNGSVSRSDSVSESGTGTDNGICVEEENSTSDQTSGQFSGSFEGQFNSNQQSGQIPHGYNYVKGNGKKMTFENPNAPGGSRKLDYNVFTGTYKTHSPIALDLNGSGAIETTGSSTAKVRHTGSVGQTVSFDINGDGVNENIEWLSGGGDGLLVDDRDGGAASSMNGNRLFGDANGKFSSGYEKLAQLDANGDGALTNAELQGLKVWQDNGDAQVDASELKSLADIGVDQISVQRNDVVNSQGETLMQSVAQRHGQSILTEDVWFGQA
jgi:EF hand